MANHICNVDCKLEVKGTRRAHIMYASEPSSAAGRYQWELNRDLLNRGRRAWRASGQGQSRACRVWDNERRGIMRIFPESQGLHRIRSMHRLAAALGLTL